MLSIILLAGLTISQAVQPTRSAPLDTTLLVSKNIDGTPGDSTSFEPIVSGSGRYAAYTSLAANIVPGDTNDIQDIYVADLIFGGTVMVSVSSDGTPGANDSERPVISYDGRFVAFTSLAANLVTGDTNGYPDVFLHDRDSDEDGIFDEVGAISTVRISTSASGEQGTGPAPNFARMASISADGRYVSFESGFTNLVPDDTNLVSDIFVKDTETGGIVVVSVSSDSVIGNLESSFGSLSANGRWVVFTSRAANLEPGDENHVNDIFVHDRDADGDGIFDEAGSISTVRVSESSLGEEADGASETYRGSTITNDGQLVVFTSSASNLVSDDNNFSKDIFLHDRSDHTTVRISMGYDGSETNGYSYFPFITPFGNQIGFVSGASNLVPNDTNYKSDIFIYDLTSGTIQRASLTADGLEADGDSGFGSFRASGTSLLFHSEASNLIPEQTIANMEIYARQLHTEGYFTLYIPVIMK
jgi:hypothetical protein